MSTLGGQGRVMLKTRDKTRHLRTATACCNVAHSIRSMYLCAWTYKKCNRIPPPSGTLQNVAFFPVAQSVRLCSSRKLTACATVAAPYYFADAEHARTDASALRRAPAAARRR